MRKRGTGTIIKGWKKITIEGNQIFEHRYIMEKFLKRKLLSNEVIHHKNNNKLDNKIENLEIVTKSEHKKLHPEIGEKTRFKRKFLLDRFELVNLYKKLGSYAKVSLHYKCSEITIRRIIQQKHKSYVK